MLIFFAFLFFLLLSSDLRRVSDDLTRVERKLGHLMDHMGIEWPKWPDNIDQSTKQGIVKLIGMGKRVDAITAYRHATGVGLKEAKDVVDALAASDASKNAKPSE
jgi:hypothetical protein